ncbi:MAG: hypothetical protein ABIS69_09400 [Sediminibacterium sp.]
MTTPTIKKSLTKVMIGMAVLLSASIYSCNDSDTKDEPTETVVPVATDSMNMTTDSMHMHGDSTTIDTSGKGSQPTPPRN